MAVVSLHSAATGLSALNTQLDVIANNLANINTEGFKSSRVNFQDLLYQEKALPGTENANGDQRPTGLYIGLGVKVSGTEVQFTQGSPIQTGNPLHLYIENQGFFQVQVEDSKGANGIAYTRAGNFTKNSEGELVLASDQGRRLQPTIQIPDDALGVQIGEDGQVYVLQPGEAEAQQVGQIELSVFVNPAGLKQIGENLYVETGASGPPQTGTPGDSNFGTIRSGMLEGSNVDPTKELIDLIRTQRAFEMNSNVIRAADETLRAVGTLRR